MEVRRYLSSIQALFAEIQRVKASHRPSGEGTTVDSNSPGASDSGHA
ncbi:hypothetical protein SBA4_550012 [Candidatus Sulfopaludibacter sp. SbA4]|nr:hypothetical protein SBA4_550012 [Candidatus Sulfopaludibacter sp. SbA4]